ncbi:hypothetical protein F4604DRAFT_1930502 [Suillus subluteus]|nr:hypothetical protein F4604DRAFT_1930502 [Suillus subluteus]
MPDPLDDTLQALVVEPSHPEQPQDPKEIHLSAVQHVVITAIHATDLTLGLRCIPAGFHVVIKTDGSECQTSNNLVHVDQAVVEWTKPILLYVVPNLIFPARIEKDSRLCDPSSKIQVSVYASFELGPMLGHGEVLRTFEISIRELLDRTILFQPKQGEVVSPCTSLFMTLEQRLSDENDTTVLCPVTTLTSRDMDVLVLKMDAGHHLLARYLADLAGWCLQEDDPHALNEVISLHYDALRYYNTGHAFQEPLLGNLSVMLHTHFNRRGNEEDLDQAIALQMEGLALRPVGHTDQSLSLNNLANQLSSRFDHRGNNEDLDQAIC